MTPANKPLEEGQTMNHEISMSSTPAPEEAAPRLALVKEPDDGNDTGEPTGEPLTALEEKQQLLAHHVRLVARGLSNGLFCFGATGGLGKSRTIQETLLAEGADVRLINSHITALSLYETLYFNRTGKVIVLDDCDNLYGDLKVLGLLRSALWGQSNQRIVTYTSSQLPAELPNSHVFESRIIMTATGLQRPFSYLTSIEPVPSRTTSPTRHLRDRCDGNRAIAAIVVFWRSAWIGFSAWSNTHPSSACSTCLPATNIRWATAWTPSSMRRATP